MLKINEGISPQDLQPKVNALFECAGQKIQAIKASQEDSGPSPVFTIAGQYTSRGWTEWTQGFQFGCAI